MKTNFTLNLTLKVTQAELFELCKGSAGPIIQQSVLDCLVAANFTRHETPVDDLAIKASEVVAVFQPNQKIAAIKELRCRVPGLGLLEAKLAVEATGKFSRF